VSKRHQSSRRRSYGRRQHELHERESRRHFPEPSDLGYDEPAATSAPDPFAFHDLFEAAGTCVTRAIARALLAAESRYGLRSYRDTFPSAVRL